MPDTSYLRLIELENFKSFTSHIEIPLSPGFTLVHGPNGTGKSNLLDAICCAFGCEPRLLRVSSYQELLNSQGIRTSQSAYVSLHIQQGTKEDVVRVDITATGTTWSLNNKPQSVKEIRTFGVQHGFHFSEGSLGIIRQNYVSHLLDDPKLLSDAIENANGSKNLLTSIQTANSELLRTVESHKTLESNLTSLHERVQKEEKKRNSARHVIEVFLSEDTAKLHLQELYFSLSRTDVLTTQSELAELANSISATEVYLIISFFSLFLILHSLFPFLFFCIGKKESPERTSKSA